MRKILLTICIFSSIIFANAQSPVQWTLHSTASQVRNGFNNNFSYLYTNKADKTNPVIIGVIKISDGTNVTDSVALRSWVRSYVSTHGGSGGGSMVYPAAGIPLSNGTVWLSSISNNSNNWNTAYTDRNKWDGGVTGLAAATGRTSLGATTTGSAFFTFANPGAIAFPRINADNSVSALSAAALVQALGLAGGGISDAAMRQAITDSLNSLRSNAIPIGNVAVLTADSTTNKYATKKQARDYAGGGTSGSLPELSSNPTSGNIYIHTGDKKIHYKIGGYWHRVAILDSVAVGGSSSTLLNGLVSYWKFNDASGNAVDSKNGYTGTVTDGTPTYSASGKVGNAITFAGAPHFLVGTTTNLRLANISVSFTFKTTTSSYLGLVTNMYDNGTNYYGFSIATELDVIKAYGFNGGTSLTSVLGTTNITTGAWFHVVFESDGTNIKLYINGTQEGGNVSFPYSLVYNSNNNFDIGARNNGGIPFTGTMDEVKVWNRGLTQSEVTEDYNNVTNGIPLL